MTTRAEFEKKAWSCYDDQITAAVTRAKKLTTDLGAGRLDTVQAVAYGRSLWPWGASSPVPASCGAGDVDWTEAP